MRIKRITKNIYVAEDGKEFLTEEECEKYEKIVKEILSNIKYFRVRYNPDLTETGLYQNIVFVAVFAKFYHKEIVFEWALRRFGSLLGESVMGYGFQPKFIIEECVDWGNLKLKDEKIFLSPKSVDGFPENINYITDWGFKC